MDIRQKRKVIFERQETNKLSPIIASPYYPLRFFLVQEVAFSEIMCWNTCTGGNEARGRWSLRKPRRYITKYTLHRKRTSYLWKIFLKYSAKHWLEHAQAGRGVSSKRIREIWLNSHIASGKCLFPTAILEKSIIYGHFSRKVKVFLIVSEHNMALDWVLH